MKVIDFDNIPDTLLSTEYSHLSRESVVPLVRCKFLAEQLFVSDISGVYIDDERICFDAVSSITGPVLSIILEAKILKGGKIYKFNKIQDGDQSIFFEFSVTPDNFN